MIVDLVPLGLENFDGDMVAWLGGFCGGFGACWTSVCQDIGFLGVPRQNLWVKRGELSPVSEVGRSET
jgi:hypothetical protein